MERLRREVRNYSAILIIYLVLLTLLRWRFEWQMVLFWLGAFLGLAIYNLDHLVYLFGQFPEDENTARLKQFLMGKDYKGGFNLLVETAPERKQLVGHSVIFQAVLVILTFFAVTSSASFFGRGLVMGMLLYSIVNQGLLITRGQGLGSWFWQTGIRLDQRGEAFYFLILGLVFLFLSRLLI